MQEAMDLDELVCRSICAVENPELRKRLASNIVMVGGGSKTEKLVEQLEDNVFLRMKDENNKYDSTIDSVEILLVNV